MRKLVLAFLEGLQLPAAAPSDDGDLAARLAGALAAGREAWPELQVDAASFARHLGRSVGGDGGGGGGRGGGGRGGGGGGGRAEAGQGTAAADVLRAVDGLHAADLYLACACLDDVPGAAESLEAYCRPTLVRYLSRISGATDLIPEICQRLFASLLVAAPGAPPKIADYRGRSTLGHWAGVAAQRLALNDRQASRARHRLIDRLAEEPLPPARGPEDSLLRRRHKPAIEAAIREAVARLTERERVVMRLHLVGGTSTTRIAKIYGVNQATVSRWLAAARRALWARAEGRLRAELGLLPVEVESLLRNVASQLDVSLSGVLGKGDTPIQPRSD